MGGTVQGVISNATPWPVKYTIRETMLQTKNVKIIRDWDVSASIDGEYSQKAKIVDEKPNVDVGGSVKGGAKVGYKNNKT